MDSYFWHLLYKISGIQSNLFYLAGKMVVYIMTHLDIGILVLNPALYMYIVTGDVEKAAECCSVEDVPDFETKEWIKKVLTHLHFLNQVTRLANRMGKGNKYRKYRAIILCSYNMQCLIFMFLKTTV